MPTLKEEIRRKYSFSEKFVDAAVHARFSAEMRKLQPEAR